MSCPLPASEHTTLRYDGRDAPVGDGLACTRLPILKLAALTAGWRWLCLAPSLALATWLFQHAAFAGDLFGLRDEEGPG